jgi:hypothetical protein
VWRFGRRKALFLGSELHGRRMRPTEHGLLFRAFCFLLLPPSRSPQSHFTFHVSHIKPHVPNTHEDVPRRDSWKCMYVA